MGKELFNYAEYANKINSSNKKFRIYLERTVGRAFFDKLVEMSRETDLYVFSGVIRNFFIKEDSFRDLDIVLSEKIDVHKYFNKNDIKKNSFGGYKIKLENFYLDLWYLKDTWAFKFQIPLNLELPFYIPTTVFFNFSAIVYLFNENKFIFSKHFLRFLKYRRIDVVYKANHNYDLCIVNSMYYSKKYNFELEDGLIRYLEELYYSNKHDFGDTQLKHFGEIVYSKEDVVNFINEQLEILEKRKKKKKVKKELGGTNYLFDTYFDT